MKRIILHLPTIILCFVYRLISCILSKFKKTRIKSLMFWDRYEDKLFTIFPAMVIGKPLFQPIPSKRYLKRRGLFCESKSASEATIIPPEIKARNDETIRNLFEQYGLEIPNEIIKWKDINYEQY